MSHQCIRVESSPATRARLQSHIVIVIESRLIVSTHGAACNFTTEHLIEVGGGLRTGSSLVLGFLLLLNVPLLLARLQVDLQTLSAVLSTADIAHEHFGSKGAWRFLNCI